MSHCSRCPCDEGYVRYKSCKHILCLKCYDQIKQLIVKDMRQLCHQCQTAQFYVEPLDGMAMKKNIKMSKSHIKNANRQKAFFNKQKRLRQQQKSLPQKKKQLSKKKQQERLRSIERQKQPERRRLYEEEMERQQERIRLKSKHKSKHAKKTNNSDDDENYDGQKKKKHEKQRKSPKKHEENKKQKTQITLKNRLAPKRQKMQIDQQASSPQNKRPQKLKSSSDEDEKLLNKYFGEEISAIKQKPRKSNFFHFSPNQSLRSLIDQLDHANQNQSSSWFKEAVIDTESQNLHQNTDAPIEYDNKNAFEKNEQQNVESKNNQEKYPEKVQAKRNCYSMSPKSPKSGSEEDFLTDSLKKGAEQYHQREEKEVQRKKHTNEIKDKAAFLAYLEAIYGSGKKKKAEHKVQKMPIKKKPWPSKDE